MKKIAIAAASVALAGAAHAQPLNLDYATKERFATVINLNGKLCAQVLEVRSHDESKYYVLCETHRDKLAQRGYYVELKTGKVE